MSRTTSVLLHSLLIAGLYLVGTGCYTNVMMRPILYQGTVIDQSVMDGTFLAISKTGKTVVLAALEWDATFGDLRMFIAVESSSRGRILVDPSSFTLQTGEGRLLDVLTAAEWEAKTRKRNIGAAVSGAVSGQPGFHDGRGFSGLLRANTLRKGDETSGYLYASHKKSDTYVLQIPLGDSVHEIHFQRP